MPAANAVLSVSVVSAAVTSTRIGFESAWRVANVTASVADPRWPPAPLAFASGAPLPLAAARVASPRGDRPAGSNTNPLRSTSPTSRNRTAPCFGFAIRGARVRPI